MFVVKSAFLLLLSFSAVANGIDMNSMPGMDGGGKPCQMFSCSKGYAPVPKKRGSGSIMRLTSAGCDAMGGGMVVMAQSDGPEKPYAACCDEWHACYQICGSNKVQCDKAYETCVDAKCAGYDEKDCSESAKLNIMLMQFAGCGKFEGAQNAACECISKDKDKHVAARKSVLEKFYKKHNPGSVHKVEELIKKADTAPKLAKLLQKLVQKYPASIERVDDPQRASYQKMMDEARAKGDAKDDNEQPADEESDETEDLDGSKDEF
ncbi:Phospholipase A2, group XIIA [Seminavis robusta]|uniref:Phospholipase A2, group XIIA n=1 Tax=Seminavis robusta TaxID=568900 RepID=A0A9N8HV94_9STRA|nr:Phospholipase A2, group XIIA [Seminavis robusta]|eukprot:Sro1901_g304330.1 Phospholipase A2, group XIIA (264) ;mRNA; r:9494-10285